MTWSAKAFPAGESAGNRARLFVSDGNSLTGPSIVRQERKATRGGKGTGYSGEDSGQVAHCRRRPRFWAKQFRRLSRGLGSSMVTMAILDNHRPDRPGGTTSVTERYIGYTFTSSALYDQVERVPFLIPRRPGRIYRPRISGSRPCRAKVRDGHFSDKCPVASRLPISVPRPAPMLKPAERFLVTHSMVESLPWRVEYRS